jgi:DNA-binding NtrC family response regulator
VSLDNSTRILVVDDDEHILSLLKRYLERSGFIVETASTAGGALNLFRSAREPFALVVTDLRLGSANGEEMLESIRQIQPHVPALISSGYVHVPHSPRTGFLQKPYLPQQLVAAVKAALAEA